MQDTTARAVSQRDLVAASLRADDLRETHRPVYPLRSAHAGRDAVQTGRWTGAGNTHRYGALRDAGDGEAGR